MATLSDVLGTRIEKEYWTDPQLAYFSIAPLPLIFTS